jgi:hypothetical protein
MTADRLEIRLNSVNENADWDNEVRLRIVAYLDGNESFNQNTLIFDCDPVGSNCERSYLEVEFPNQEAIAKIRQFLSRHLEKDDAIERTCQISVVDAKRINTWAGGRRNRDENFDYLTVMADSDRISFGALGNMTPDIRFYKTATKEGSQDQNNGEQLLTFFDEIIEDTTRVSGVSLQDEALVNRCLPLFERGEYPEAARLAGQILEERTKALAPESQKGGAKLMRDVFSPEGGSLQIASDNGEQVGLMSLFAGTYQAIRNPLSHRTPDSEGERYLDDLDQTQTKNILHLSDYLLTTIERHRKKLKEE